MNQLEIFIFSIFSSTVSPIFGIGGGLLNVPFLTHFEGVSFASATTASLFAGACLSLSASVQNVMKRKADVRTALSLLPSLMLGSLISAYVPLGEKSLYLLFSAFTLFISYLIFFNANLRIEKPHPAVLQLSLFLLGVISGVLGIGGGAILVPFLLFFYKMGIKEAIATTGVMTFFVMLSGFISHYQHGDFETNVSIPLAVPALFMGYLGAYLMLERIRTETMRKVFAAFLVFVALSMALKAF